MTELEREQRADRAREKRHSTKKMLMGGLMAVLVAGGAYILMTSGSGEQELAQSEITAPQFAPSSVPVPNALPPVPLPDATPLPKAQAPTPAPRVAAAPAVAPVAPVEESVIPQTPVIDPTVTLPPQ